ncbi:MAG: N-6 DNA methylase [Planctomycetes bacterium]|nr:N-6 DNA methylase [Planctomycetota bacterium]
MATDHELRVHRDWIGLLQPVGLVVSPPALLAAQAFPDKNILKEQQALLALITPPAPKDEKKSVERPPLPLSFEALATQVLGWKPSKLAGSPSGPALPESLELVLPEFGETLRPTFAVPAVKEDAESSEYAGEWVILVQELADGTSFDEPPAEETKKWHASPQIRLERLLRETGVPIGILANGRFIRLVYKPRGESSGHVTWPVHRLVTTLDRDMLSALCMLLGSARLFALPRDQRLPHILKESRKYQNVVSTKLAGQVLEALNELLRGFQSANEAAKGRLLDATVREDPDHVYGGLLAVLLRLVFILYAEERGLLSTSAAYVRNYSLVGLFDKLRIDAGRFPDTMDQRYGAWSRLLVLFRMVHDGAKRGDLRLPPRYGHLFDPDGWAFLEGRPLRINRVMGASVEVPKVPDGVVQRVLEKLLLLDSDRLSYRALDVEQIGSVYENMMGFRLERAVETSIGVGKEHVVVGLETLLAKKGADREKLLKETASVELTGKASEALKDAGTVDDLVAALSRRISPLTPRTVPAGGLYLQPTDERRRSGSHYTPRELTEPIVRTTLQPILEDLGPSPKPEHLLALKVCDPAMGSGAFLVESCRQLAEQLVKAYDIHGRPTDIPPDEDVLLYAQRQVAQHCLYGVDKNPFAVDLGKLSLWLATLARDHAFTFLDHALRHGDSLVGLTREQIASFHWAPEKQLQLIHAFVDKAITEAMALRAKIPDLSNSDDVREKRQLLRDADDALAKVRMVGDAVVASFFSQEKPKAREEARKHWETTALACLSAGGGSSDLSALIQELRAGDRAVPCFHWAIEFPEVFGGRDAGFDAIVGNPPFLGGKNISGAFGSRYLAWLQQTNPGAVGQVDLVAYFFRTTHCRLRTKGASGLLATNTIAQGDTRSSGLGWICTHGGEIFSATRRLRWPGKAAVMVSVVHTRRTPSGKPAVLNGLAVERITPFLFDRGPMGNPKNLLENDGKSFAGPKIDGAGFIFDDSDPEALGLSDMRAAVAADPRNSERIFPLMGGEDMLRTPRITSQRWVIDFDEMTESEAANWPILLGLLERKAKPHRLAGRLREYPWWRFERPRPELRRAIVGKSRLLMHPFTSVYSAFAFVSKDTIVATPHVVFAMDSHADFCALQARPHELWVRFFGSTLKDDLRYTPSDCFETYPFPESAGKCPEVLERVGRDYYDFRSALMARTEAGLTKVYGRFHDPYEYEPSILKLRELHAAMDRAVLDAYGWTDIQPTCAFLLDYEEDGDAEASGGRRRKKPWRYRWPDDIRDEVLVRLLELNAQRAKKQAGTPPPAGRGAPTAPGKKTRGRAKAWKPTLASQSGLFGEESE